MSSSALPPGVSIADARLEEVTEGAFAYVQPDGSWWINNAGFLVGRRGVTSVDACATEERTRAYLQSIRSVTDLPVRTLVNTHHHGDHTHGNFLFESATIVAHDRTRDEMNEMGPPGPNPIWTDVRWGDVDIVPPFLTFHDEVTLYWDETPCLVRHFGTPAHTTNDSVVWIPERSLLFAGDLVFNGGTPFLLMGSVAGALEVLEQLRGLGARTVVPGHGDVCGPQVIDEVLDYVRFVADAASAARTAGLSPLEAARHLDLGSFSDLRDPERIVGNLHRAFAELDGQPRGSKLDLVAALTDMVAYNGGRRLSCYA
jgi:cyclase